MHSYGFTMHILHYYPVFLLKLALIYVDSQVASSPHVDSKTVMFLSKTAPEMLTHTDTDPLFSLTV